MEHRSGEPDDKHSFRPTILLLMVGPKFDLEWEFGGRLEGMSAFSCGYLLTTSSAEHCIRIGRYDVLSTVFDSGSVARSRLRYLRRCIATLRKARLCGKPVDMIVTYDPLFTGLVGLLLGRFFGAEVVCEVNGDYASDVNYQHIDSVFVRFLKRKLLVGIARYVLRRVAGIKTLYDGQLDLIGVRTRPQQVTASFPSYVRTSAFANIEEQKIVLLVGFPFEVKGVDIAILAFRRIADRFPDWRLKIMGYYPDLSDIEKLSEGCGQIFHQAPVRHRHIGEHIGRCGVFILPSRTEGMGRVLVEAMAAGKPRIGSTVGGIPTVIDDSVDGFLVQPADIDGLAEALNRLLDSEELRRRLGSAAADRAKREFSEERYFRNVETFLRAVAKHRSHL